MINDRVRLSRLLLVLFVVAGCEHNNKVPINSGSLRIHSSAGREGFMLIINERFLQKVTTEKADKNHPQLKKSVARLLDNLLITHNCCLDENNKPAYIIIGKQGTVYQQMQQEPQDDDNYNKITVLPFTYFGQCL